MALMKVTTDTNECFADRFLNGFSRITIPLFQRGYAWEKKQFERYKDDIERSVEIDERAVFIGAVVAVRRKTGINEAEEFEIVDGQQRLLTIYLTVMAAVVLHAERGNAVDAARLARRYLFQSDTPGANTKVFTSRIDSVEFAALWAEVLGNVKLIAALGASLPCPPAKSGTVNPNPQLKHQYARIRKWLRDTSTTDHAVLDTFVEAALSRLSMVYLELSDPASAPAIFEGLNNGGMKTTVGDLVRNEVFSKLRADPDLARKIFDGEWFDFAQALGNDYEDFFFPYGLILDRQTRKSDLFSALRAKWEKNTSVPVIIAEMREYVPGFLAIRHGKPMPWAGKALAADLGRISRMGCVPAAVLPFYMRLLHATEREALSQDESCAILAVVEGFLVRRAICGYEPTGLHAVFKGLWDDVIRAPISPTAATVAARLSEHKTVQWPDDTQLRHHVETRDLYGTNVVKYVTTEYDRSLAGDIPSDDTQIEHIMPKSRANWLHMPADVHKTWLNRWANLVVCSPGLNRDLGDNSFSEKRARYLDDAMFKSVRIIADTAVWGEVELFKRAAVLADFAVGRWPDPR